MTSKFSASTLTYLIFCFVVFLYSFLLYENNLTHTLLIGFLGFFLGFGIILIQAINIPLIYLSEFLHRKIPVFSFNYEYLFFVTVICAILLFVPGFSKSIILLIFIYPFAYLLSKKLNKKINWLLFILPIPIYFLTIFYLEQILLLIKTFHWTTTRLKP